MSYDPRLAERVRAVLAARPAIDERAMFGGLCFLADGKMVCGLVGDELMVRVGPEAWDEALARPHARPMDFTGRPLRGFVYVAAAGLRTRPALTAWVERGLAYAALAPARPRRSARPRPRPRAGRPRLR